MAKETKPYGLPTGPDGIPIAENWEGFRKWISDEATAWDWLNADTSSLRQMVSRNQNPKSRVIGHINQIAEQFNSLRPFLSSGDQSRSEIPAIQRLVDEYFKLHINSDDPVAGVICSIAKDPFLGPASAYAALSMHLNEVFDASIGKAILGVVAFYGLRMGWTESQTANIHDQTRAGLRKANDEVEKIRSQQEKQSKEWAESLDNIQQQAKRALATLETRVLTHIEESDQSSKLAIDQINLTDKTYKELMTLRAPVDYWKTAEDDHRKNRAKAWASLFWFLVVIVPVLLFFYGGLVILSVCWVNPPDLAHYVLGGLALIVTTAAAWATRILVRIYLSERHMETDSAERVTMVKTYLALMSDGQVDKEDRKTVLAPLFRNMSDGIVKDDGSPPFSLVGLLGKS